MGKARLAGTVFQGAKKLAGQTSRLLGIDKMGTTEKIFRFGPDALVGAAQFAHTPGDFGDKLIVGGSDFLLSSVGGLALAAPAKRNPALAGGIDAVASLGMGYYGAPIAADAGMRAKDKLMGGEGTTAYERANVEYEQQLKAQVIAELDAAGLLNPQLKQMVTNDNTGTY